MENVNKTCKNRNDHPSLSIDILRYIIYTIYKIVTIRLISAYLHIKNIHIILIFAATNVNVEV